MEKIKCPYCGAEFYHDYVACPKCGKSLKENNKQLISKDVLESIDEEDAYDSWLQEFKEKEASECWIAIILGLLILGPVLAMLIYNFNKNAVGVLEQTLAYIFFTISTVSVIVFAVYECTHKETVVKKVECYTVLAAKYGSYNVLMCDGKVLDQQKVRAHRGHTNMRVLKGKLPNGKRIWAEFRPNIQIHLGDDKIL